MPVTWVEIGETLVNLTTGYEQMLFGMVLIVALAYLVLNSRVGLAVGGMVFVLFSLAAIDYSDGYDVAQGETATLALVVIFAIIAGIGFVLWYLRGLTK